MKRLLTYVRLLPCRMGWHSWLLFDASWESVGASWGKPETSRRRSCRRCGRREVNNIWDGWISEGEAQRRVEAAEEARTKTSRRTFFASALGGFAAAIGLKLTSGRDLRFRQFGRDVTAYLSTHENMPTLTERGSDEVLIASIDKKSKTVYYGMRSDLDQIYMTRPYNRWPGVEGNPPWRGETLAEWDAKCKG